MRLFHRVTEFAPALLYGGEGKGEGYLILYFYPKANTPGCTREAQDFTALLPQFRDLDAQIVGVSPDKPEAQARFVESKSLAVTMLSDPDKALARSFGAVKESGGILRSTFLIDRAGIVRAQWTKVKVDGHAQAVLDTLRALHESDGKINPIIAARRANRAIAPDPIPRDEIETLLTAAHLAPSCFNNQPWRFVAIDDDETLAAVKEAMPNGNYWAAPAPAIIAVASRPDLDCQLSDNRDYFLFGCGIAVGNLMIQATGMGLIAHPIAGFNPAKVKGILGIPDDYVLITLVVLARPGDPETLSEKHREEELGPRERKPLSEVVTWNRFKL